MLTAYDHGHKLSVTAAHAAAIAGHWQLPHMCCTAEPSTVLSLLQGTGCCCERRYLVGEPKTVSAGVNERKLEPACD